MQTLIVHAAAVVALAGFMVSAATATQAQTAYPNKPVKLVVGFAAGGPTDILARVVGAGMGKVAGEQFYIENRTGAGGNIATEAAAQAEPDGYTVQVTLMSSAVNESLFKNFKIKFSNHFEPIGGIAHAGLVLLVHPTLDVKNVSDLIKLEKSKPGQLLYASAGAGTATHLAAELFNFMTGTKLMPVHYKGGGETIKDLLSGEMKIMFSTIPPVLGFVKEGRLRGIATTGLQARQGAARASDHRGVRRAGVRHAALVRARRAKGHAARGDREAERNAQEDADAAGGSGDAGQARLHDP